MGYRTTGKMILIIMMYSNNFIAYSIKFIDVFNKLYRCIKLSYILFNLILITKDKN